MYCKINISYILCILSNKYMVYEYIQYIIYIYICIYIFVLPSEESGVCSVFVQTPNIELRYLSQHIFLKNMV